MKIVQDSLLGASLITKRDIFINRELMMHLLMWVKKFDGRLPIPAIMIPRKSVQGGRRMPMDTMGYGPGSSCIQ